jgi:transcriptional regulator with XRE-family HTH domain
MRRASPDQVKKDLGRRVAELRRSLGLTQAALAERADLSTPYVARIEAGVENLTLESVTGIANLLEVQVLHLFLPPTTPKAKRGRPTKGGADQSSLRRGQRLRPSRSA